MGCRTVLERKGFLRLSLSLSVSRLGLLLSVLRVSRFSLSGFNLLYFQSPSADVGVSRRVSGWPEQGVVSRAVNPGESEQPLISSSQKGGVDVRSEGLRWENAFLMTLQGIRWREKNLQFSSVDDSTPDDSTVIVQLPCTKADGSVDPDRKRLIAMAFPVTSGPPAPWGAGRPAPLSFPDGCCSNGAVSGTRLLHTRTYIHVHVYARVMMCQRRVQ